MKEKLCTLAEAAALLAVTAVTLRKYALRGLIGAKLGPEPQTGKADRRPWYLTQADVRTVRELRVSAHQTGRPRKG